MRIILDENIPRPLAGWFEGHEVTTIQGEGWSGLTNGLLIERIDGAFDLFITADKNLRYQQNFKRRKIAILIIHSNRLDELKSFKAGIEAEIAHALPGSFRSFTPP
jgi:hypothetical protein